MCLPDARRWCATVGLAMVVGLTARSESPAATDVPAAARADTATVAPGYWGDIHAPSDSTLVTFHNPSRAVWEWPLIVPYSVVNLPLRWTREGIGATFRWAERRGFLRRIRFSPVPEGIVPSAGYGGLEGVSLGLNAYLAPDGSATRVRLRAQGSTNEWQKYAAGVSHQVGTRWHLQLGGGYRLRPNLRYFGVGPTADVSSLSYYKDERSWGGALVRNALTRTLFLVAGVVYSSVDTRLPDSDWSPSLPAVHPDVVQTPGFNQRSDGVMTRIGLFYDGTAETGKPVRGTLTGATVGLFQSTNEKDVSFVAYRFEVQKFVPLWHSGRALACRGFFNWLDNRGNVAIPFQRMFINETPDQFRGYDSARWRDRGITGVTFEYRFPALADRKEGGVGLDWVAFTDVGQVFGHVNDIAAANLTVSGGFGLRLYAGQYFGGTVEFAWADEGFQFRLTTGQLFQYSRDVLFNGREETLIH